MHMIEGGNGFLASWITNGTAKPFYARKEFEISEKPVSAKAYVCGLGQFIFRINGQKVGDHELDPGWTDYRKYVQYVTFDILPYLKLGANAAGAEVGNGWYIMETGDGHYSFHFPEFMPPNPNGYTPFGESLILAVRMEIGYADGSAQVVETDPSWKTAKHPVVSSNVYGSEKTDGRLVQKGWDTAGFDDSAWAQAQAAAGPEGSLEEQAQPPVKVIRSYPAEYLHTAGGRDVYDLGQNIAGILEFTVKGKAGQEIRIYPAEKLDAEGNADQMAKGWLPIDTCITYVIAQDDVPETCRMKFTYFAGRYLGVETQAQVLNLRGDAVTSAWKKSGSFDCDDERYLKIYDLVEKAVEANMLSVHTDCPTIERFAWQEPNHLMAPSIFYMKDGKTLWEKFLKDLRAGQHTAEDRFNDGKGGDFYPGDGLMPGQAPCYIPNVLPVPGMGSFYDIIPWGSTCILGTRWHYLFYGDRKIIEENYDPAVRYLAHLKTKVTEDGFICHGLGDWGNPDGKYARENVETAFLYADAKVLAEFAEILGKKEDCRKFLDYAEQVRKNYNEKLLVYDEEKKRYCYRLWENEDEIQMTQAAEALPLYWGLVPEECREDVAGAFREVFLRDGSFRCGEVGQPYVIQTAADCGMNDLIGEYIVKETHPSYYAFVLEGETTLGEYWESNPRSHCHDMMGHIIEWYYNGIAGIRPLEPGFKKALVKPYLPESMDRADCTYHSVSGDIHVSMRRREDRSVELHVEADSAIECEVCRENL